MPERTAINIPIKFDLQELHLTLDLDTLHGESRAKAVSWYDDIASTLRSGLGTFEFSTIVIHGDHWWLEDRLRNQTVYIGELNQLPEHLRRERWTLTTVLPAP